MFTEDQLLPISALQHLIFCERQCALIHVERMWAENRLTVEGRHLHERAHSGKHEISDGIRIARGLWIKSHRLGLVGQADVVEFHQNGQVIPIEYKRGKPKKDDSDRVQICAQAICLEEMLDAKLTIGYLFYGKRKRRTVVEFDDNLREFTLRKTKRLREMIDNRETPHAIRKPKCNRCSLYHLCLPDSMRFKTGVEAFNRRQLASATNDTVPDSDDFEFVV